MRKMLLVGLVLLVSGKATLGQHFGELTSNYSYMHYVPVDNFPTANLNGGGGFCGPLPCWLFRAQDGSTRIRQPKHQL
jgi:hypothetical protein